MNSQLSKKTNMNMPIALSYSWFEAEFLPKIRDSLMNFWESNFYVKLFSITNFDTIKKDKLSIGETYFTKQIPINAHQNATFRMSSEFIRITLHSILGSTSPKFQLASLSELEVKILNSFLNFLCKNISSSFLHYDEIPKYALKSKEEYNLTFFIKKEDEKATKFAITLPKNILVPNLLSPNADAQNELPDNFSTNVKVRAGKTKIALSELKMLSLGDIVLLDNSNINKMYIKSASLLHEFKINPDPGLIIELDEDEHDIGGASMANKNMWDDIQIEVSAEFEKVKMTLGELKQIANGMVIDLADAFSGKISLVVEDRVVAKGDLVIINDRYGVRLNEVAPSTESGTIKQSQNTAQPKKQVQTVQEEPTENEDENSEEENFDYSDFEDED